MMINTQNHSDFSQEMQRCRDYIQALEVERRKIQVFQRELPLSLELVQQAIEACKQQLSGTTTVDYGLPVQSECNSEQTTSSDVPVFEEFIPIKRASSHPDGEEHQSDNNQNDGVHDGNDSDNSGNELNEQNSKKSDSGNELNEQNSKKSDWLRSAQLWNQTPLTDGSDPSLNEDLTQKVEASRNGGNGGLASLPATETEGGGNKKNEKDEHSNRKTRRCWSPELHRRFLHALQQLGGSHVATPKQIREQMKVDGLTNDEVKSHLQKYRLHTRRPSPTIPTASASQTPQFVVVGGIWVPPEYAATMAESGEGSGGIYSPIATVPPLPFMDVSAAKQRKRKPLASDGGGSRSDAGVLSNSSAASSSTHVTAALASSPDY